jgi:DNA-binding CsgD family transcriptional regulator
MYRVDRYSSDKFSIHSAYNKKVSDEMQTSINKIRTYIKSSYKKLKVKSNVELSNIYLRSR